MADPTLADILQAQQAFDEMGQARMRGRMPIMPPRDSMRNANTSLGEFLATQTGNPEMGPVGSGAQRAAETVGHFAPELTGVPQMVRAGGAVAEAANDPSIPNVTNAGVQSAAALMRPMTMAKILLGGYGAATAKDSGVLDMLKPGDAKAAPGDRDKARAANAAAGQAKAEGMAAAEKAKAEAAILSAKTEAERQAAQQRAAEADAALERERKAKDEAGYRAGLDRATTAKDKELSRERRFSDTETAKLYNKTAGWTPFAAGIAGGALYKAATGPAKTTFDKWGAPAIAGIGPGEAAAHAPSWYDAHMTEIDNPQLRAAEAFAREAPDGPERRRAMADVERLQKTQPTNPIHDAGQKEFYDPVKFGERTLSGALQGAMGGKSGSLVGPALSGTLRAGGSLVGEAAEGLGTLPGRVKTGLAKGDAMAAEAAAKASTARIAADEARALEQKSRSAAAGNEAAAAAAARRSADQADGQSGGARSPGQNAAAQPLADPPLPPATSTNPATFGTSTNNQSIPPPGSGNQAQMLEFGPGVQTTLAEILQALKTQPVQPVQPQRALPPPRDPGRGRWAEEIQPVAREALMQDAAAGGSIGKGNGERIKKAIEAGLPAGAKSPSSSDVRERIGNLRNVTGDKPTPDQLKTVFDKAPDSILDGKRIPAVAAIGASGVAASAATRNMDVENAALGRMTLGQDINDMSPRDIAASSGKSEAEVSAQLDDMKRRAGTRTNGRTVADQIKAIRDRSSPTGHREPGTGRFAPAP